MTSSDTVIAGIGMITPVGLSAAETSASVRANLMRFTEITWQDNNFEPYVVGEVVEEGLPALAEPLQQDGTLTHREMRLLRLGTQPIRHALAALPKGAEKPGLALALPEHDTTKAIDPKTFLERFAVQTENTFDLSQSVAQARGRAGGLNAIGMAIGAIESGQAKLMLAGGIDTFRDPYVLGMLTAEGRVKNATNLDAFVPGEAAAFLLLTKSATAQTKGLPVIGTVSHVSSGLEPGHLYTKEPYQGEGLAATFRALLSSGAARKPLGEVYSSMNGESHWAKEWGVAFLRNQDAFDPAVGINHPADCYGDAGAATGPLMTGLAAIGILQRFRKSPALIYCSSDRGERAALIVEGV